MNTYHRHAQQFVPELARPVRYRTQRRPLWARIAITLLKLFAAALAVGLLCIGTVALIARLYLTEAQLESAFLQGMQAGAQLCRGRM